MKEGAALVVAPASNQHKNKTLAYLGVCGCIYHSWNERNERSLRKMMYREERSNMVSLMGFFAKKSSSKLHNFSRSLGGFLLMVKKIGEAARGVER